MFQNDGFHSLQEHLHERVELDYIYYLKNKKELQIPPWKELFLRVHVSLGFNKVVFTVIF